MKKSGFTLIETLLATVLFALAILAVVSSRTTSLRMVRSNESLFRAVQLAQLKMTEMEMKFQKLIDRDGVKTSNFTKENGTFDAPYDNYRWSAELVESPLKVSPNDISKILVDLGADKETVDQQLDSQKLLLTNLNKALKENYVELRLLVEWDQFGRKNSVPLVTHLIPAKPKITLTQTADENPGGDSSP